MCPYWGKAGIFAVFFSNNTHCCFLGSKPICSRLVLLVSRGLLTSCQKQKLWLGESDQQLSNFWRCHGNSFSLPRGKVEDGWAVFCFGLRWKRKTNPPPNCKRKFFPCLDTLAIDQTEFFPEPEVPHCQKFKCSIREKRKLLQRQMRVETELSRENVLFVIKYTWWQMSQIMHFY